MSLWNKEEDEDEIDYEIRKTVNKSIENKHFQGRLKNKKDTIEQLLDQNIEEENKGNPNSKVKFNQEITKTIGGKKIMKKGDSKIMRQQTGYNKNTKKMLDQSK